MNELRAIRLFVRLAELGSFTQVADELNASKSMISKELSRLEDSIGARLLHRSTRHIQLTPVGEGYLKHCREILLKLDDANAYVKDMQATPKGKLRINAPMALGLTDLAQAFSQFMAKFPAIELDIHLDDEPIDLIEQGFDLGFRASSRPFDSNYIGKPLTQFRYVVCSSQNYLENHPNIEKVADLAQHNCFVYSYFLGKNVWPLGNHVEVRGSLRANNTLFMMQAIKDGLGIGFIPDFVCKDDIASNNVVEILPDVERPNLTLFALYPARQHLPPALKQCIDFLQDWFSQNESNRRALA